VGILAESEPNGDFVTFADADDLLNTAVTGVRLRPGMTLRITGTMGTTDIDDVFKIDTGTAASVRTVWTVTNVPSGQGVYYYNPAGVILFGNAYSGITDGEFTNQWTVDASNSTRYVDLWNARPPVVNLGSYTCIIIAN
jgi:hypothetical protein